MRSLSSWALTIPHESLGNRVLTDIFHSNFGGSLILNPPLNEQASAQFPAQVMKSFQCLNLELQNPFAVLQVTFQII